MRKNTIIILVVVLALGFLLQLTYEYAIYWFYGVMASFGIIAIYDVVQTKNSILKNYPLFGHFRYILREIAPEIRQYFVEGNIDGTPFNKNEIDLVNSRAEMILKNHPFGTEMNLYEDGHEWVSHSQFPKKTDNYVPHTKIGGAFCKQPYQASLLNVSAMSYGSLSSHAIMALNGGAKIGGFYHNTGEGSISPFHLKMGGDIVWQIGTGYFGCRTPDGAFDNNKFKEKANHPNVKMIEIKLSQGAKPGHGGILPAIKNTIEIAAIRGVEPHTTVHSPPYHSTFNTPEGLLDYVELLRELSGGKPIGFKLCIGDRNEVDRICQAMVKSGKRPDFITIDGAEGGTGAAPLEFSNHIGMPGQEAIVYMTDMLRGYDLKKEIKLIYSGKVISGFDIVRALAAGADLCNSARAMMFALGCIQSLRCNNNSCPTGVATQNKHLEKGLNVNNKKGRVANFQKETVKSAIEMFAAMGLENIESIGRTNLYQWSGENNRSMTLCEIFPDIEVGSYLEKLKEPTN
jgi:glutamate synthase domain-containing protein 2